MSLENFKEYVRRCASDPEMRQAAKEFGTENLDEHINVSRGLGLEWDRNDLAAFRTELVGSDELEDLDQEELEAIAGGVCTITAVVVVAAVSGAAGAVAAATGGAAAAGDGGW